MRRTIMVIGFTLLSVLSFVFFFGVNIAHLLGTVALCLFVLSIIFKKTRKTVISLSLLVVVIACAYYSIFTAIVYNPIINNYSDKEIKVKGTIIEAPYESYGTYYYKLKTDFINGKEKATTIMLKSSTPISAKPFHKVYGNISVEKSSNNNYISKGIYLYSYVRNNIVDTGRTVKSINYYMNIIKEKVNSVFTYFFGGEISSFLNSLILGDKYALSDNVKESFRTSGISYVIVVSGMHLAIFVGIIEKLFNRIKKKKIGYVFAIVFILFYICLTGISASVLRSGIIFIVYLFGKILSREHDSLTSLGLACFVVLFNPYLAGEIGLLLSFSATLGILLWEKPIKKFIRKVKFHNRIINKIYKSVSSALSLTLSATLFTLPISIICFGYLSTLQIIYGVFVSPVVSIVLMCCIAMVLLYFVPFVGVALAYPFAFITGVVSKYILFAVDISNKIPYATVGTDKLYIYIWLGITLIMIGVFIILNKNNKTIPYIAGVSIVILIAGGVTTYIIEQNSTYILAMNTGYGMTVSVSNRGQQAIITSGGAKSYTSDVVNYYKYSYSDNVIMSVLNEENYSSSYAQDMVDKIDLDEVLLYDKAKSIYLNKYSGIVKTFSKGYSVKLGEVLIKYFEVNSKIAVYVYTGKTTALILPQYCDCSLIPTNYRDVDILIYLGTNYNASLVKAKQMVVCTDEENVDESFLSNEFICEKAKFTADGNVKINM